MNISDEKRKELYKLIFISEVKKRQNIFIIGDEAKQYNIEGLDVALDFHRFENIKIYIPGMAIIDEYMIKDFIIDNLTNIFK